LAKRFEQNTHTESQLCNSQLNCNNEKSEKETHQKPLVSCNWSHSWIFVVGMLQKRGNCMIIDTIGPLLQLRCH